MTIGLLRTPPVSRAVLVFLMLGGVSPATEPSAPSAVGQVAGVVRFTGVVPPAHKIVTTDNNTILHHDLVVDPPTKGLRHVFAILENAPAQPKRMNAPAVLLDQRDLVFVPRVVAVQQGQPVRFDNSDLFNHSVMATATREANQFNVFVLPGKPIEHVFEVQKAPVLIGCSLHPWMRAWVYVAAHPWFAVSDAQGRFRIDEVPPGPYTLWLRHPDSGLQERRTLGIEAGRTTTVTIEWQKVS